MAAINALLQSMRSSLHQGARGLFLIRSCSTKSEDAEKKEKSDENSEDHQYEKEIRDKILKASLQFVPKYGWTRDAIANGAESMGYSSVSNGIFVNGGADLINYFYIQCNEQLKHHMIETNKSKINVEPKEFIQNAVEIRLRMITPYLDKWPQAIAIMSLPPNVPVALANLLTLVDDICYYAGDKSVDFNWYIRRVGVGSIYKMTELYMIQDKSLDFKETWRFLDKKLSEAFQLQQILNNSSDATAVAKDVVTAAFITARNILHLNVPK